MTDRPAALSDPAELTALLLAGDRLVCSVEGWCLVQAGRIVADETVRKVGPLVPAADPEQPDQLPGFPLELAQTWRLPDTTSQPP